LAAGENLPATLDETWRAATGTALYEAYGMSECSTFISAWPAAPVDPGALGRPQPGRSVAIVDEDGAPVPLGEEGIIAIDRRDPGLMLGYLGAPRATARRYRGNWFLTGDRGAMAADGQITYLGRNDDMMNAGGHRVSPLEVEDALAACPGIAQVGVTDVEVKPDVRVIVAFYTGLEAIDPARLDAFAQERLARYKQPRAFVHLAQMPTGPNGKLSRKALRDHYRPETA
jgi:acyl-coenzyme A synthetase/AMP-(fatty) acid ligase